MQDYRTVTGERLSTQRHISVNRIPTQVLKGRTTPYEAWYGRKPDLSNLRLFGCVAYAHIPKGHRRKLDSKTEKLRFVGYSRVQKGYRRLNTETKPLVHRKYVTFNELEFDMSRTASERKVGAESGAEYSERENTTDGQEVGNDIPEIDQQEPRPERVCKPTSRFGIDVIYKCELAENEHVDMVTNGQEPATMTEALQSEHADEWRKAAEKEYTSLMEYNTWSLADLPDDRKQVGSKWVFKVKRDQNGDIDRFKCRLVSQGYTQVGGIDYEETFAPVAKFSSIRSILAVGVKRDMVFHQMDVETGFLNGMLKEEIHMSQPEGFIKPDTEHIVCKLHKSLYGLKQSPRCWYYELQSYLLDQGFTQNQADLCVYFRWKNNQLTVVSVYVDDLIMAADVVGDIEQLKLELNNKFSMKD